MGNEIEVIQNEPVFLAPAGTVEDFLKVYQLKKDIVSHILVEGVDFGKVPGSDKPALLKSGAEKMTNFYALAPEFVDIQTVEDWTGQDHNAEPFFYYRQKCNLYRNSQDGKRILVASADGSCNSWEKKYRYRQADRICPNCGQAAIIKGRQEYGGGWLCFAKKGGCGAKFADNAPEIIGQEVGQIKNPDVAEQVNTMLKMAQKRALVAATLIATNTSDYFTQDIEDLWHGEVINATVTNVTEGESKAVSRNPDNTVNSPGRPLAPEKLKEMIGKKVQYHINAKTLASVQDRKVLASILDTTFNGEKTMRYELCEWLVGQSSTQKMKQADVNALLDWLGVRSFNAMPEPYVITEINSAHTAALKASGQAELIPQE